MIAREGRRGETGRKKKAAWVIAEKDEVMAFYTTVLRGETEETAEGGPTLANRMKAAEGLMKYYAAQDGGEEETLGKLDRLLEEMKRAVG